MYPTTTLKAESKKIALNVISLTFWLIFILCFLYLSRILIVLTYNKLSLGILVLLFTSMTILVTQKIVKNLALIATIISLTSLSLISAWVNNIALLQFLAFARILVLVYLIYNLVWFYIDSPSRAISVLRWMLLIAVFQFPITALQRYLYPFLPERIKYSEITGQLSIIDFGMGTFNGDTAMAFALIGLLILLLFNTELSKYVKLRWFLSGWITVTVIFSNSQIHHLVVIVVWLVYFLSHLRFRNIAISLTLIGLVIAAIFFLSESDLMTFPFVQNTINKFASITQIFNRSLSYDKFTSGGQARNEAIAYYLNQPIKWIGDGPGSVYNTATGSRSVGGWGHVFTFYAEVGLIGWLLSILIFFVIAFPLHWDRKGLRIEVSLAQLLIFFSVNMVTLVKYPMGNSAIMFTYCVLLICDRMLARSDCHPDQTLSRA